MRHGVGTWFCALVIAGCTTGGGGDGPDALTLGSASAADTAGTMAGDGGATDNGDDATGNDATGVPQTAGDDGTVTAGDSTAGDETSGPPSMSCADDPAACDAWVLPPGAAAWEPISIGGPATLAPSGDVLAAFDIEAPEIAFVISARDVAVLDLATRSWTSKRDFASTFPDVGADLLLAAYSVPAGRGAPESVTLASADTAYIHEYDLARDSFAFVEATVFGAGWALPEAPAGASIRAMWVDIANGEGWIDPTTPTPCGAAGPIGPNLPVIAGSSVHVMEAGACFEFFAPVDYASFPPFALPGAPAVDLVGGALFSATQGLWLFRGA